MKEKKHIHKSIFVCRLNRSDATDVFGMSHGLTDTTAERPPSTVDAEGQQAVVIETQPMHQQQQKTYSRPISILN